MSPTSYQTAPPRISKGADYRDVISAPQPLNTAIFSGGSSSYTPVFIDVGAEGETRTRTGFRPLPPQGSVSTNFTTSACALDVRDIGIYTLLFGSQLLRVLDRHRHAGDTNTVRRGRPFLGGIG